MSVEVIDHTSQSSVRNIRGRLARYREDCSRSERSHTSSAHPGLAQICSRQSVDRADSRFAPNQWEMALLCNDVSHWLGASLISALCWWNVKMHSIQRQCCIFTTFSPNFSSVITSACTDMSLTWKNIMQWINAQASRERKWDFSISLFCQFKVLPHKTTRLFSMKFTGVDQLNISYISTKK